MSTSCETEGSGSGSGSGSDASGLVTCQGAPVLQRRLLPDRVTAPVC